MTAAQRKAIQRVAYRIRNSHEQSREDDEAENELLRLLGLAEERGERDAAFAVYLDIVTG